MNFVKSKRGEREPPLPSSPEFVEFDKILGNIKSCERRFLLPNSFSDGLKTLVSRKVYARIIDILCFRMQRPDRVGHRSIGIISHE